MPLQASLASNCQRNIGVRLKAVNLSIFLGREEVKKPLLWVEAAGCMSEQVLKPPQERGKQNYSERGLGQAAPTQLFLFLFFPA